MKSPEGELPKFLEVPVAGVEGIVRGRTVKVVATRPADVSRDAFIGLGKYRDKAPLTSGSRVVLLNLALSANVCRWAFRIEGSEDRQLAADFGDPTLWSVPAEIVGIVDHHAAYEADKVVGGTGPDVVSLFAERAAANPADFMMHPREDSPSCAGIVERGIVNRLDADVVVIRGNMDGVLSGLIALGLEYEGAAKDGDVADSGRQPFWTPENVERSAEETMTWMGVMIDHALRANAGDVETVYDVVRWAMEGYSTEASCEPYQRLSAKAKTFVEEVVPACRKLLLAGELMPNRVLRVRISKGMRYNLTELQYQAFHDQQFRQLFVDVNVLSVGWWRRSHTPMTTVMVRKGAFGDDGDIRKHLVRTSEGDPEWLLGQADDYDRHRLTLAGAPVEVEDGAAEDAVCATDFVVYAAEQCDPDPKASEAKGYPLDTFEARVWMFKRLQATEDGTIAYAEVPFDPDGNNLPPWFRFSVARRAFLVNPDLERVVVGFERAAKTEDGPTMWVTGVLSVPNASDVRPLLGVATGENTQNAFSAPASVVAVVKAMNGNAPRVRAGKRHVERPSA